MGRVGAGTEDSALGWFPLVSFAPAQRCPGQCFELPPWSWVIDMLLTCLYYFRTVAGLTLLPLSLAPCCACHTHSVPFPISPVEIQFTQSTLQRSSIQSWVSTNVYTLVHPSPQNRNVGHFRYPRSFLISLSTHPPTPPSHGSDRGSHFCDPRLSSLF